MTIEELQEAIEEKEHELISAQNEIAECDGEIRRIRDEIYELEEEIGEWEYDRTVAQHEIPLLEADLADMHYNLRRMTHDGVLDSTDPNQLSCLT